MPISEVFNMDCMEYMRQFPDKHFELAVVDPPYGIGLNGFGNGRGMGKKLNYKIKGDWDAAPPDKEYWKQLFRVSARQIIWGANNYQLPTSQHWIFWDKGIPDGFSFAQGELAWTNFPGTLRRVYIQHSGAASVDGLQSRIHPTQKPIALYKWIFQNYAQPGWKILDTHLGSGSSRIAAWDMGLDFYATELDADYFEAMEKRFQTHISKPTLFNPDQQYTFTQTSLF